MASKTEIANRALFKLGSERIESLDQDTPAAAIIKESWDTIVNDELARYPWVFAKAYAQLAATTTTPAFRWQRQFNRAADDLRLIEVGVDQAWASWEIGRTFELQGRLILTDMDAPLNVSYVRCVTNSGEFDAPFVEALACRLAVELCQIITGSVSRKELVDRDYARSIAGAKRANAIQSPPRMIGGNEPFNAARHYGSLPATINPWTVR